VIVGDDTPNTRTTSRRGMPPSTASSTRMRRSREYAFIPTACQNDQLSCTPLYAVIVEYWRSGLTAPQIAERIGLSRPRVNNIIWELRHKLGTDVVPRKRLAIDATAHDV